MKSKYIGKLIVTQKKSVGLITKYSSKRRLYFVEWTDGKDEGWFYKPSIDRWLEETDKLKKRYKKKIPE